MSKDNGTNRITDLEPAPNAPVTNADAERMFAVLTDTARSAIAARLGKSYGGDRDIYTALGYKVNPDYTDYLARYERQDMAKAVIDRPVNACWELTPLVTDKGNATPTKPNDFETAWLSLVKERRIYKACKNVDRLASIGRWAVLFLGFNDDAEMNEPVEKAEQLLYLQAYSEANAKIKDYVQDANDERFGLPFSYTITIQSGGKETIKPVHWSRVIHVAEDALESNYIGQPRLRAVLNRLQDLELVIGGSSEMFWRGGFPGIVFSKEAGGIQSQSDDTIKDEIEDFVHAFKRYLTLSGVDAKAIEQQIADPSNNVNSLTELIAAAVPIPKRILMGSERGELASSQDTETWNSSVAERSTQHCEPEILRPLIDRLIDVGVLSEPTDEYIVTFPNRNETSEKDQAEVGFKVAQALKAYSEAIGAEDLMPFEVFVMKYLGWTQDDLERVGKLVDDANRELARTGAQTGEDTDEDE